MSRRVAAEEATQLSGPNIHGQEIRGGGGMFLSLSREYFVVSRHF